MPITHTATEAGQPAVANLLRGELLHPVGRDRGRLVSEYREMMADIERQPKRSPLTWFALKLAGQA